jgi:Protein of unknown function (DUF4229)
VSLSQTPESAAPAEGPGLASVLVLYALARIGLLAVVAALLVVAGTPIVIAVLVGLIVALPLSLLLFRGLRSRLEVALAASRARRGEQRAVLRAGLRGDAEGPAPADDADDVLSRDRPERQADGGGD